MSIRSFILNLVGLSLFSIVLMYKNIESLENQVSIFDISPLIFVNLAICTSMIAVNLSKLKGTNVPLLLFWLFEFSFMGFVIFSVSVDNQPLYLFDLKNTKYFDQSILIISMTHAICAITQLTLGRKVGIGNLRTIEFKRWGLVFNWYLILFPIIILNLGGTAFILRRVRFGQNVTDLSRPVNAISEAILYVTAIVLYLAFQQGTEAWKRANRKKVILLFLLIVILSNPLANARQTTILLLLPLAYAFIERRMRYRICFAYGYLIFTFFLPSPVDRYTGKIQGFSFNSPSKMGDFDAFGQLMNTLQHVDMNGLRVLNQFFGSVLFFVPRQIWSSKPIDSGILIAKSRNLNFQNLSCPWLAESYLNLGAIGIFVTSIVLVFLLVKTSSVSGYNFVMSGFLASIMFIALRGSLLQATGKIIFGLVLIRILSSKSFRV